MSGQTCMQIDDEHAANAILEHEGWALHHDQMNFDEYVCNSYDGKCTITFERPAKYGLAMRRYISGLIDFRKAMHDYPYVWLNMTRIANPWHRMSNEEIFIKCELEQ